MAWTFSEQIHALTGLDAASNSDSETGEDFRVLSAQWLVDAAREVINALPPKLKEKCAQFTALTDANGTDMDGFGDILYVTRETANSSTIYAPCRRIPSMYGGMAADSSSLMYYGTATDPVYWIESNSSDTSKLFVKPDPTASQDVKIYHVGHPSIAYNDTSINNFPDEAEYLVVLRAAITALEYQAVIEEDPELYLPVMQNLKQDYTQGLQALGAPSQQPQQQRAQR